MNCQLLVSSSSQPWPWPIGCTALFICLSWPLQELAKHFKQCLLVCQLEKWWHSLLTMQLVPCICRFCSSIQPTTDRKVGVGGALHLNWMCTEPPSPSFFPAAAFLLLGIGSHLERIYIVHSYAHCVASISSCNRDWTSTDCVFEGDPQASPHNTPNSWTVIVSVRPQETITQLLRAWLFWESSFQSSYLESGDQSTPLWRLSMYGVVTWSCAQSLYSFKIFCCLIVAYVITVISTAAPAPLLPEPSCQ